MANFREFFSQIKEFVKKRKKLLVVIVVISNIIKAAIIIGLLYFPMKSDAKTRVLNEKVFRL